ncbi:universal stress protein [Pseudaquidulcibacter saccharophilus]|uniref:universal stress protein n=1 Tax=Pseudaquidulcibacter saccharophilus TaxID=2831900 RepID=UPI001EFF30F4|nr:universal stress protein [Pseudaquidulcibacter saccharophilus]
MLFREILVPVTMLSNDMSYFDKISRVTANLDTIITLYFSTIAPEEILHTSAMGFVSGMEGEFIERQKNEDDKIWNFLKEVCTKYPNFKAERMVGKLSDTVIARSALSDLIMVDGKQMVQNPEIYKQAETTFISSRAPVMILGKDNNSSVKNIAIAWNGSPQAARAVKAALPFMRKAEKVSILQLIRDGKTNKSGIFNPETLLNTLNRHDIKAEVIYDKQRTNDVAVDLLNLARKAQADTLVVGLYSTSRAQEVLFGGTSKTLLKKTDDLNMILSH